MSVRTNITLRCRLSGDPKDYQLLNEMAGANRYTYNNALNHLFKQYEETGRSDYSYEDLGKWYTQHKKNIATWLSGYSPAKVKLILRDLSVAYKEFVKGERGKPKFKSKRRKQSFPITLYQNEIKEAENGNGYLMLKRGVFIQIRGYKKQICRYSNPRFLQGRIVKEITDRSNTYRRKRKNKYKENKWFLYIQCEVDAVERQIGTIDINDIVGIDRNIGQVADSNGIIHYLANTKKEERRKKVLQRRRSKKQHGSNKAYKTNILLAKKQRKIRNKRNDCLRKTSKKISSSSSLAVLEDLKIKNMTRSAKGTMENPGKNVKQKSGLNRVILKTAWGIFEIYLGQKMWVIKIPPHYTSQKCSRCGTIDKKNRLSQSKFKCLSCGFSMNADSNAANNIRDTGACSFFQNFGSKECSLSNQAMVHRTFKTPLIIHGRKGKKGVSQHNSHEK